jgi:hypothetical protein
VLTQNLKKISNKQLVTSNIISFADETGMNVSLKTRRPPAVVDKKITKQKKLIMGFFDVAQFMFSPFFLSRPTSKKGLNLFMRFCVCRCFYGSQSCVRNVAANSAPALIFKPIDVLFRAILFRGLRRISMKDL